MKKKKTPEQLKAAIESHKRRKAMQDRLMLEHEKNMHLAKQLREDKKRMIRITRDDKRREEVQQWMDNYDRVKAASLAKKQARYDKYMSWRKSQSDKLVENFRRQKKIPANVEIRFNWEKKTFSLTTKMSAEEFNRQQEERRAQGEGAVRFTKDIAEVAATAEATQVVEDTEAKIDNAEALVPRDTTENATKADATDLISPVEANA